MRTLRPSSPKTFARSGINDPLDKAERASRKHRPPVLLMMALAFLIGMADIALITVGTMPIRPRVVQSSYELIPVVRRAAGGSQSSSSASLLSTKFKLSVPPQVRGRKVAVSQIRYYSQGGRFLGLAGAIQVTGAPSGSPELLIPPLQQAEIGVRASPDDTLGVSPGSKIYAEVEGKAGSRTFKARSAVSAASGNGA